ncbi:MAG: hypothetical protein Kow006_17780 [Gammaproteobacteria bacterium]
MSGRFLLIVLVGLAVVGFLGYRWFLRTPPEEVARKLRKYALWFAAGILILLAASGRASWFWALLGGALPFAQRLFMLWRAANLFKFFRSQAKVMGAGGGSGAAGRAGQASTVTTRFLSMRLDHETGALSGEVLEGRFQGRSLDSLDLEELLQLLEECQADEQSVAVLEAYLDREHPDEWRERFRAGGGRTGGDRSGSLSGAMSREEAYQVLGLEPGADREAVIAAHRRLMQKLHPDRGGSTFLAAKINQAKETLLNQPTDG